MSSADNKERLQELIGDDYRLQWIVGHGGMSTVWLADDVRNDREVAIKVLRPEFSDNTEFLSRFRNEAEAAESIASDNVVATYDYREVQDPSGHTFCFMALEYVRGESLADMLAREDSLPEELALDVLEQAAHGLSIIHRMGLVHRDIKPGNLMVTQNGKVKITDFGIAKAAAAVPLTRTGMVVGTAQYVSPEQAQGMDVTPASDVYSLGVVGYEMLAGKRPFTGDSSVSVALAHISQEAAPLSTAISAPARELIGITLRKDPQTRFADGNELANAVSQVRLGHRPPAPASAALAVPAAEPSASASTEMLAKATHPTTTHPESSGPAPAPVKRKKQSSGKGFGLGMLIALLLAALGAAGFWAYNEFAGTGGSEPSTSQAPTVVTEWVEPSTPEEEPTPETVVEETTVLETEVITTVEEPPRDTPGPAPQPDNPQTPQPVETPTQQPTPVESPVNPVPTDASAPGTPQESAQGGA